MKKRYSSTIRLAQLTKYLHNGETITNTSVHCCEIVKESFNKTKTIELKIRGLTVKYTTEEINKWVSLLKDNGYKFKYKIDDEYHYIYLNSFDFYGVQDMYLTMVLVRYLWFEENDCLIDRIFDILEKAKNLSFTQALLLAQCYDNTSRSSVFNLCFENTIPLNYTINKKQLEITGLNSYFLGTHKNQIINQLQYVLSSLILDKIKTLIDNNESYEKVRNFLCENTKDYCLPENYYNYSSPIIIDKLEKWLSYILSKSIKVTLTTDVELNNDYIFLRNTLCNLSAGIIGTYTGLVYPDIEKYDNYKTIRQLDRKNTNTSINVNDDLLIFKLQY